jgi:hypothetical protein
VTGNPISSLIWRLPYGVRRWLRAAARPGHFLELRRLRTAEPERLNAPTLKPFIRHRCIFVHIPKAAGISVGYALFGRHTGNHATVADYQLAFSRREFEGFFTFTFVRNPWDRLVSAYHFLKNGGRNEEDRRWAEVHLADYSSFEAFVHGWVDRKNINTALHFIPQYRFITLPGRSGPQVDFVGCVESIESDFARVRERVGGGAAALTCDNRTAGRREDFRSYYDDRTREIVAGVYREDIELLGYEFDSGGRAAG